MRPGGAARGMPGYSEAGRAGWRAWPGVGTGHISGSLPAGPAALLWSLAPQHRPQAPARGCLTCGAHSRGGVWGTPGHWRVSVAGGPQAHPPCSGVLRLTGPEPQQCSGIPSWARGICFCGAGLHVPRPRQGGFTSWGSGPLEPPALGIFFWGFVPPPRLFFGSDVGLINLCFLN